MNTMTIQYEWWWVPVALMVVVAFNVIGEWFNHHINPDRAGKPIDLHGTAITFGVAIGVCVGYALK